MFHGTTADLANAIIQAGHFRVGTHFGHHMEDALKMGGDYIFEICLDEKPTDYWEWCCPEPLSIDCVRMVIATNPSVVWHNQACEKKATEAMLAESWGPDVKVCKACQGRGQVEYYPPLMRWRDIQKVTPCEKCGGYGVERDETDWPIQEAFLGFSQDSLERSCDVAEVEARRIRRFACRPTPRGGEIP